jgi:hypothetical protein
MCEFQSLYFNNDGYVVRCKQCGHYQIAFGSTMLTLVKKDFEAICKMVKYKSSEKDSSFSEHSKCVVIPTPSYGLHMLLTKNEANRFNEILEEADNEAKALCLLSLFNQ